MFRPMTTPMAIAALLGLGLSTALASGPTGTVTFQGEVFVINAPAACNPDTPTATASIGDFYRLIYRFNQSSSLNDALLFVGSRSTFYLYSQTGSLNGASNTFNAYFGSHATFTSGISGATNLAITTVGGAAIGDAVNLKIYGTVNDFFGTTGCNITIRSDLVARPN